MSSRGYRVGVVVYETVPPLDFKQRFSKKLESLGDAAMNAQQLDEAILEYSAALSLDCPVPQGFLIKRSKA